jgi:hypothetical protein
LPFIAQQVEVSGQVCGAHQQGNRMRGLKARPSLSREKFLLCEAWHDSFLLDDERDWPANGQAEDHYGHS